MQTWSNGRLAITPWQAIPEQLAALGLTAVDGMTQVWLAEDGRLTGGAEAVNRAMRTVWWARPFTYFYSLPGIKQVQNWAYRWIAANRGHLPGGTPQCTTPAQRNYP